MSHSLKGCRTWSVALLVPAILVVMPPVFAAEPTTFPVELTNFRPVDGNPVFTAEPGAWDAAIRERGWILRDGDQWRLWYTGYDGTREGRKKLGLATSPNGLNWTRHPDNPIYDDVWVEDMMIVPHEGRLFMFAEGEGDYAQQLVSTDGLRWERVGTLDVRQEDGRPISPGPFGTPTVFIEDGLWHLFYERGDQAVWHATSRDRKVWTNVSDEPVLRPGPDAYDSSRIALNQIIRHDDRYYAFYHGTDDRDAPALWTSNIAVSDDLGTWTKYPDNPLFPKDANRSSNILVPMGENRFRLYTMHGKVEVFLPATTK